MNGTRLMLWIAAAVAAVGVTTAAVTVANATGGRDDVLSQDEVSRQLGEETGAPVAPAPSGTPATPGADRSTPPAGDEVTRTLRSQAGQVVVRCDGATAFLEAWSPNPGYRVDDVVRGPATKVSLWIESDSFEDVFVLVTCQAGEPVLTDKVEPDDHGGDDDGDDRGGSGRDG
jgi:hypothetical protein